METAQSRARVARTRQDVYSLVEEILEGVYVLLDEFINKIISWPTWVMVMVSNTTFNNISAISWRSVLLEESTDLQQDAVLSTTRLSGIRTCNVSGDRH